MYSKSLENYITQKFEESLQTSSFTRYDNYFSLGGTSIKLVLMLEAIESDFNESIEAKSFMDSPRVFSFSKFIMEQYPNNAFVVALMHANNEGGFQDQPSSAKTHGNGKKEEESFESLLLKQKELSRSWPGKSFCDNIIFGNNIHGKEKPIYWTFQGSEELSSLLNVLGPEYPLYAMRSGHLLFHKKSDKCGKFAAYYADQLISSDLPKKDIIIGGNCQGAYIAWGMAQHLLSKGIKVSLLFLIEADIDERYDGNVSLIYGHNSQDHNPFLYRKSPELSWDANYKSYSVDILEADHGKFFRKKNVNALARVLKKRISEI